MLLNRNKWLVQIMRWPIVLNQKVTSQLKILILLNKEIYETNKKTIAKNAILRTAKNTAANLLRLTGKLLQESGFENIKDLNKEESANTQDFDFIAERNKIKCAISVKTRNKYENSATGPKLNSRYKLTKDPVNFAKDAKNKYNSEAAWIAISLEIDKGVFNAYFGVLSDLNGNQKGINMSQEATRKYEQLALLRK